MYFVIYIKMYSNKLDYTNYFIIDSTNEKSREDLRGVELTCRGMVFKNTDNEIVANTFPYTEEYSVNNICEIENTISQGQWNFYKSYEGTIIRIIHTEQDGIMKRLVCTHKKLDAFESYWGSDKSYGELFKNEINRLFLLSNRESKLNRDEVFDLFLDSLDTSRHYTFLMTSNDDNKVVASRNNQIYYVGSFDRETNKYNYDTEFEYDKFSVVKIQHPEKITISTSQDIVDYVNNVDYTESQGLIAFRQDKFELFKVVNDTYKTKSLLRGNNSNLVYRYIQLKFIDNKEMLAEFLELFKNKMSEFVSTDNDIFNMAFYLHGIYYHRYVEKQFAYTDPVYHAVLKSIHAWHLQDKKKNITTFNVVAKKLCECDTKTLFQMLKVWNNMKNENNNPLI